METLTENMNNLQRAIYGTNLINKLSIDNLNLVLPQLETYLNKKICLASGSNAKNFVIELLSYNDNEKGQNLRTFIKFERNNIILFQDVTVKNKTYEGGGYGVDYYENNIIIGSLKDGVLTTIEPLEQIIQSYSLSTVFCPQKVKETKDKIKKLETELSDLQRTIYQFKNIY
jgi:hypothetical protein